MSLTRLLISHGQPAGLRRNAPPRTGARQKNARILGRHFPLTSIDA